MSKTRLILVGGFLGAGKTTLLAEAAVRLRGRGQRVGLVANDQAADLVDTAILARSGAQVEEVAGGCFCCRFPDMVAAMQRLVDAAGADVLLGEPVGSCTDLSATVMQPLKDLYRDRFELAPFSVLIDGKQVRTLARLQAAARQDAPARFPDDVLYIYEKQLAEADAIALNKVDLLAAGELAELRESLAARFPGTPLLTISALSGAGVDDWLDFVQRPQAVGGKIVAVDYDTYAAGEAALGWLNAAAKLQARDDIQWPAFATQLLEAIRAGLRARGAEIAHLKLYLAGEGAAVAGNVTSNDSPAAVRGDIGPSQRSLSLVINARVHVQPEVLQTVVEQGLRETAGERIEVTLTNVRSFFPGRPQPTHRYQHVV